MEVDVDAYLRPAAGLSRSEWSEFDQVFVDLNDVRCASIPSSWCPSSPTTTQDQAKLEDVRPDRESVSSLSDWVQEEILGRLVLPLVCASVFAIPADLCDDDKPDGPEKVCRYTLRLVLRTFVEFDLVFCLSDQCNRRRGTGFKESQGLCGDRSRIGGFIK